MNDGNPLFQVFFNVFDLSDAQFTLEDLNVESVPTGQDASKFDLTLFVHRSAESMVTPFTYNPDIFDAATIRRLATQLSVVLEAAVRNPEARLSELPLMEASETADLIGAFNDPLE